jgi:hypothetical protein
MSSFNNFGIYHDTNVTSWHFSHLKETNLADINYAEYFDIGNFLSATEPQKFASFHVSFPADQSWMDRLNQVYDQCTAVFVFCSELHAHTVAQLISLDRPKINIYICGVIDHQFQFAKIRQWMDWFNTTVWFYKFKEPQLLEQKLLPQENKPKYFDILLGCERPHRNFVFNYINERNLQDQMLMTYHRRWNQDLRESDQYIVEQEGVEFLDPPKHTVQTVKYYGAKVTMSQIVPLEIYNKSYYSVVTETNAVNEFNFYTEKIIKPILAGRVFVAIAGKNYLKNLRAFGFQTFGNIIDENYDEEQDSVIRWSKALQQLELLCEQNPVDVYQKVNDIIEHNRKCALETDWYDNFAKNFANDLMKNLNLS